MHNEKSLLGPVRLTATNALGPCLLTLFVSGILDVEGCIIIVGMLISPVHLCLDVQVWVISSVCVDSLTISLE